jgi:hypothetical protein
MPMRDDRNPLAAALTQALFLNLWRRCDGKGAAYQADLYTDRDEAAADAASPSLYRYAGTVILVPGAPPRLADLSHLGGAVLVERAADAAEEAAHIRALTTGAGRRVL